MQCLVKLEGIQIMRERIVCLFLETKQGCGEISIRLRKRGVHVAKTDRGTEDTQFLSVFQRRKQNGKANRGTE